MSCSNSVRIRLLPRLPSIRKSLKILHKILISSTSSLHNSTPRIHLPNPPWLCLLLHSQDYSTPSLSYFSTVAAEAILSVIHSCNSTSCLLDPILSTMLPTISQDLLPFLDLSEAFDMVNHKTLLFTLRSLGICATAWEWIAFYLDSRTYQATQRGSASALLHWWPTSFSTWSSPFSLYTHSLGQSYIFK